jgi:hydrogenase nickel incorporation protein HypA/HybF
MHESSLIASLIEQVEMAAREHGAARVTAVVLLQGALDPSGPEHLREHFAAAAPGTILEGAELRIEANPEPLSSGIILKTVEMEK